MSKFPLRPTDKTKASPSLAYREDPLHKVETAGPPLRASGISVRIFAHSTFGLADYTRPTGDKGLLKKQWQVCG